MLLTTAARALLLASAAALLPALAGAAEDPVIDSRERGQGWAFVIGGGLKSDHEAVWKRLVALAGGPGARFVVLGTASNNPQAAAEQAAGQLRRYGAVAETLPVSPLLKEPAIAQAVRDPALVARVRAARGVFLTGGSQDRIVDHLMPGGRATPLLQAIWDLYRGGGVVAGTSAGAAIMSTTMFRDAPDVLKVMKGRWSEGSEVGPGLGFVGPDLFVDQHFLKRGRLGRMLPLMAAKGYRIGLGVEEDSAAAVRGDEVEVVGGKALFVDLNEARSDAKLGAYNIAGARLSLLDAGDRINVRTRLLTPAKAKLEGQLLDPAAPSYKPYYTRQPFHLDFFGDNVVAVAMGLLIDAHYDFVEGMAFDPLPDVADPLGTLGFRARLYKGPGSRGWYTEASGAEDYTVQDLRLDLSPVRMAQPLFQPWKP
ncbi:Cyanophycinase [Rubrivivax sp. A210]|uniref:cyanophycinase n=1 Tax=Rubrivivax sp. A210 TaxID=2772301 RepID=UPI0019185B18|nr:cyanophycinase [Rubrivivax sp. A210]CAD5375138.1 Cyanophycinase [Rubrivivax sp. A210]